MGKQTLRCGVAAILGAVTSLVLIGGIWLAIPLRITTTQTIDEPQLNALDLSAAPTARDLDALPFSELVLHIEADGLRAELRGTALGLASLNSTFALTAQTGRVRAIPTSTGAVIMGLGVQTSTRYDDQLAPLIEYNIDAILRDLAGDDYHVQSVAVQSGRIDVRLTATVQQIITLESN